MRKHLNKCKIHTLTDKVTLSFVCLCMPLYDFVWLCMAMYDNVWICMTMYDYLWLCMTMFDFVRLCKDNLNFFTWFKLFILYNKPRLCLPLFTFVYLCLPLLKWRIYAQFCACYSNFDGNQFLIKGHLMIIESLLFPINCKFCYQFTK